MTNASPANTNHSPSISDWTATPLFTDATADEVNDALVAAHSAIVAKSLATGEHPGILKEDTGLAAVWSLYSSMRDYLGWAADPAAIPDRQVAMSAQGYWQPESISVNFALKVPGVNAIIERVRDADGADRWTHHPIRLEGGQA